MKHRFSFAVGRSPAPPAACNWAQPGSILRACLLALALAASPVTAPDDDASLSFNREQAQHRAVLAHAEGLLRAIFAEPQPVFGLEQSRLSRFIAQTFRVRPPDAAKLVALAFRTANELTLDPVLILAVIAIESSFNPQAQSDRGAQGLMQIRTHVHTDRLAPFGGAAAAFDPSVNIRVGAGLLKSYLHREGSIEGALKSYVGAARLPSDGGYGVKVLAARARMIEVAREPLSAREQAGDSADRLFDQASLGGVGQP